MRKKKGKNVINNIFFHIYHVHVGTKEGREGEKKSTEVKTELECIRVCFFERCGSIIMTSVQLIY